MVAATIAAIAAALLGFCYAFCCISSSQAAVFQAAIA